MKIATKELNGIFQKSKRMSKFYIPFCGSNVELQKCLLSIGEEDKTSCKYLLQTTVDKRWPACLEDKIIDAQEYWTEHNNKNEYKVKLSFPKFEGAVQKEMGSPNYFKFTREFKSAKI